MQVLGVKHPRWRLSKFDLLGTVVGLSLKMQYLVELHAVGWLIGRRLRAAKSLTSLGSKCGWSAVCLLALQLLEPLLPLPLWPCVLRQLPPLCSSPGPSLSTGPDRVLRLQKRIGDAKRAYLADAKPDCAPLQGARCKAQATDTCATANCRDFVSSFLDLVLNNKRTRGRGHDHVVRSQRVSISIRYHCQSPLCARLPNPLATGLIRSPRAISTSSKRLCAQCRTPRRTRPAPTCGLRPSLARPQTSPLGNHTAGQGRERRKSSRISMPDRLFPAGNRQVSGGSKTA